MNVNELPLEHPLLTDRNVAIKLVGVGGAGSNAVDRLKMENLDRLQLAVINTDHQALSSSPVQDKVLIGMGVTRGLGAGGDPELGREAAEADREKIAAVIKDCDLVFLLAGMGGGTGSGAAPIVAEIAAEQGALVIAFVSMPFSFEGGRRLKQAEEALRALRQVCDAVIPLPNDVLLFLLASRYCEVDCLSDVAWNLFSNSPMGWGRVKAICDWVHNNVRFVYAFARPTKTANDVYTERAGVCRDFTHLAITFCRCMNIPARYATGYLGDIGVPLSDSPMDFSAWFEVFLSGQWYTFDARHNVPRIGRVLMAYGRDAVDAALTTSFGPSNLTQFKVWTDEVSERA